MNVNVFLSRPANKVDSNIAYAIFLKFAEHFGVNEETETKARSDFLELKNMNISLGLAINTAIALSRM